MIKDGSSRHIKQASIAACGLVYFILTCLYHQYTMISVDEFWFAHVIYQYAHGLAYRDVAPYKTVLGYYMLLPTLLFYKGSVYHTLLFMKNVIALINTVAFILAAQLISRHTKHTAVIIALLCLTLSELAISFSSQIRVDLLGYWFCLFALLALLDTRFIVCGILLGIGFCTTQKSIWYIVAINGALGIHWIVFERTLARTMPLIKMNLALAAIISAYILFWASFSSIQIVMTSLFNDASAMYQLNWYNAARYHFWQRTMHYNPLLFLLWPACLFSLFASPKDDTSYNKRFIVMMASLIILLCLIPYKQVFPYYMQVTVPIFLITYSFFCAWLIAIFQANHTVRHISKPMLWLAWLIYALGILFCIYYFALPYAYSLIITIPLLIDVILTRPLNSDFSRCALIIVFLTVIFTNFIYPGLLFPAKLIRLNNAYQHAGIDALESLVDKEHDYVAGIELLYYHNQPIAGLRHLMGPAIDYLYQPTDELRRVMLSSLYEDPNATEDSIIKDLSTSHVAMYVDNYRMIALPPRIKEYLDTHYAHFWNSIYTYAPSIPKGTHTITLLISGRYRVLSNNNVIINGHALPKDTVIYFKRGEHEVYSDDAFRLQWTPDIKLNSAFNDDHPEKMLF